MTLPRSASVTCPNGEFLAPARSQELKLFRSHSIFLSLSFLLLFCCCDFHCSWIRRSGWQAPLLPLGRVLPALREKRGRAEARGGGAGSAALSHARKKDSTSSLRPEAPADYHRDTVGSFPPSAAFCVVDSPLFSFR